MAKEYNPIDWYWLKEDGMLFSSASLQTVKETDPAYVQWASDGTPPSRFPKDEAGKESDAEMQAVLAPWNLFGSLKAYLANVRYEAEVSGVTATVGGEEVLMSTRREDRDGARDTLLAIISGLRSDGAVFKFADGVSRPATNDEMKAAIAAAFAHVQACFDREAEISAAIDAGKTKTRAQVDKAFAKLAA